MKNLKNKNAPPNSDLVQVYLRSSWDIVTDIYKALPLLTALAEALGSGALDDFITAADIDTLAELNAILTDATFGDFASQAQAEAGADNTVTMTPLRVAQAIAVLASGLQNKYDGIIPPGATDDDVAGYSVGSFWIDIVASPNESYRCSDNSTGAAVWIKTTLTSDELAVVALTGDSDDLIEGTVQLLMTVTERSRLALMEDNATADQTDLEIVNAYNNQVPAASQIEMEAGTEAAIRTMSPLRISQAITALGSGGVAWTISAITKAVATGTGTQFQNMAANVNADLPTDPALNDIVWISNNDDSSWNVAVNAGAGNEIIEQNTGHSVSFNLTPGQTCFLVCILIGGTKRWGLSIFSLDVPVASDPIWDAVGDLVVGTGNNTAAKLAMGTSLQTLRVNAGATALEFADAAGGGGGGLTPVFKAASFTAVAGEKYFVDSSGGAIIVTLPVGADTDNIKILDIGHTASVYNITVNPNGVETIDNDASFIIDQNEGDIDIAYNNTDSNWEVSADGTPDLVNAPIVGPVKTRTIRTVIEQIVNATADEFDFNNIPAGYDRLIIKGEMRSDGTGTDDTFNVYLNEDLTNANYHSQHDHSANGTDYSTESLAPALVYGGADGSPATAHSYVTIEIENPGSANNKLVMSAYASENGTDYMRVGNGSVTSIITAAIVRIRLRTDNDPTDQITGTLTLYGEKDEEIGGGAGFEDINAQIGTTYEFTSGDLTDAVTASNVTASTYDVPDGLGQNGSLISLLNIGTGEVTITVAGTDTLGSSDNKCATGKAVTILKIDATTWWVIGGSA